MPFTKSNIQRFAVAVKILQGQCLLRTKHPGEKKLLCSLEQRMLLCSLEQRTALCFGCSLCRGAGSQGWPMQAETPWWNQEAWPYLKHIRASEEHYLAHFRGKYM